MQPTKAQVAARKKKEAERKAAEANRSRAGAGSSARQAEQNKYKKLAANPAANKNGDTTVKEGHTFVFKDGKWLKKQPTSKPKVADYNDAQGNTYDGNTGRLKSKVAAKPAAKPSSGGRTYASSSSRTTTASVTEKPKTQSRNIGPVASGDDYARNKDPKKYNPLMQKTFDYQTGDSPKQRAQRDDLERARSDANKAQIKQGPPVPAQPAKPASPPSPNQPKKNDKGTKVMTLAERIRRRRLGLD
jgi:hypothetical protein